MTAPLRVGLLQCGHIHPDLVPVHGDYPEVFGDLLGPQGIEVVTYDVTEALPHAVDQEDGWLVSGSACSAYDELPWIGPLEEFLLAVLDAAVPLVAVCFGHQVLAQALGVRVAKAEVGWGVGAHDYEVVGTPQPWMAPPRSELRLIASHQDQVAELPPGAELYLTSPFCPVAGFTVGPRAITVQAHPEFTAEVSAGLVERRRDTIGSPTVDAALATLDRPLDNQLYGAWMAAFLRG